VLGRLSTSRVGDRRIKHRSRRVIDVCHAARLVFVESQVRLDSAKYCPIHHQSLFLFHTSPRHLQLQSELPETSHRPCMLRQGAGTARRLVLAQTHNLRPTGPHRAPVLQISTNSITLLLPAPTRRCAPPFVRRISMSVPSEAAKASSAQPEWYNPTRDAEEPVLKVHNSLTRSKVGRRTLVANGVAILHV
jgi:hypothetical protein